MADLDLGGYSTAIRPCKGLVTLTCKDEGKPRKKNLRAGMCTGMRLEMRVDMRAGMRMDMGVAMYFFYVFFKKLTSSKSV